MFSFYMQKKRREKYQNNKLFDFKNKLKKIMLGAKFACSSYYSRF